MSISSTGIGSGLDVNSIVSQLVALEKKPLTTLQTAATFIQTQISAYGQVQSLLSDLSTAASSLAKSALWTQNSATSSNPGSLTAVSKAGAASGTYSIQVSRLASAQSLASTTFANSSSVLGSGKLTIELGTWSGGSPTDDPATTTIDESATTTFTPKAGATPLTLTFDSATTSLADIRDAINGAQAGVTASIVRDTSGTRLTIRSSSTGEDNALRISTTDLMGQPLTDGLATLNYNQPHLISQPGMTQTVAAANARATVNGLSVSSNSNKFSDVIENVDFTAFATTTSSVSLTVGNDTEAQRKAVQGFVTAYNALNTFLQKQTGYDAANKVGGTLQGDSTVLSLRNRLRGIVGESGAGNFSILSLTSSSSNSPRDGSINLDTAKLDAALSDPAKLSKLFAGDTANGVSGMARRLTDFTDSVTGSTGLLNTRKEGLNQQVVRNKKEQEKVEDRAARLSEKLNKQYQALDTRMASLSTLSNYITQQTKVWTNSNN